MLDRALYSIQESRRLLGGISRNTIYQLLHKGQLASVVIGSRRFISADAIAELIKRSTTTARPARKRSRPRPQLDQSSLPLTLPLCTNVPVARTRNAAGNMVSVARSKLVAEPRKSRADTRDEN